MKFYSEKDLAMCGLACVLCSSEDCPGCKARGCKQGCDCSVYQCVLKKGLDGCYQCDEFPCGEDMLKGIRNRAFNRYAKQFGKQALLDRLKINYESGITYHKPDGLKGDYDLLETEEEIYSFVRFGTSDPYKKCPVFETEHFTLRLVSEEDAEDLLKCYSDSKTQELFNADKCTSDFRYQTLDEMKNCIGSWLSAYEQQAYIRFTIVDKSLNQTVGTIEMFGMIGQFKTPRGILRIDIDSSYETQEYISELLILANDHFFILFDVERIATKAIPIAKERIAALQSNGYELFEWETGRENYWIHNKH